jgi:hypothetical protein
LVVNGRIKWVLGLFVLFGLAGTRFSTLQPESVDYMTLLKDNSRWVIIAKSFNSAPKSR